MAAGKWVGKVTKAYSPKRGKNKFFFMLDDGTLEWKGMAYLDCMELIVKDAVVEIEGYERGGWLNPKSVEQLEAPKVEAKVETLKIGHVGHPKVTHHGIASYAKTEEGEWVIIPVTVTSEFFEGKSTDTACSFPNRGQCTIEAEVKRNGDVVVAKILRHKRNAYTFNFAAPFSSVRWYPDAAVVNTPHGQLRIRAEDLPIDLEPEVLKQLGTMDAELQMVGKMVAYSLGVGRLEWETESIEVTVTGEVKAAVERLVWNDKVARATSAVRKELAQLLQGGTVLDVDMVVEMFLSKGLEVNKEKAESLLTRGYDARYLKALQEMGQGRSWACTDGFFVEIGEWVVWERCIAGAATYILPKAPNTEVTGELTTAEWVSVLARILPDTNKMALRYGEIGQALSGHETGVRFANHVEDDEGNFDGWLEKVRGATEDSPGAEVGGLPTLESLGLLLAA